MKAAIYTPYLETLGGGELYMLSIARVLLEEGWEVAIEAREELVKKAETRFNLNLKGLTPVKSIKRGENYDACFWLSDGSIPILRSKNNILHFQRPFKDVDGKSLMNRMKFFRIKNVIVNSQFTASAINEEYSIKSLVVYPPVSTDKFRPKRKENIILYVGRFSQLEQSKGQDVLLETFLRFRTTNRSWKLVLAGGSEVGRTSFVDHLKKSSEGKNVEILESPSFRVVKDLFGKAKIYWSAAGFGVDEQNDPQRLEHFGITVVEAMAAKAVPIVFNAGGHKEIIANGKNGYLWSTKNELLDLTRKLISSPKELLELSKSAQTRSKDFSYDNFKTNIKNIL